MSGRAAVVFLSALFVATTGAIDPVVARHAVPVAVAAGPAEPSDDVDALIVATVTGVERVGALTVVDQYDRSALLAEGGSASPFALRLPDGAQCPGDSANDQWRVQSFLIPADDDVTTLRFGEIGPDGDDQFALYGVDTNPLRHGLTEPNDVAGEPGRIVALPAMSFAVFPPGTIEAGRYRLGIACTFFRALATYWDTEMEITLDPADTPAGFVWRVVGVQHQPAPVTASTGSSHVALAIGGAAAGLAAVAGVGWKQRRARRGTRSKETR